MDEANNDMTNEPVNGSQLPEYGALASQFPKDYDPYVFGKPEPKEEKPAQKRTGFSNPFAGGRSGQQDTQNPAGDAAGQGQSDPRSQNMPGAWQPQQGQPAQGQPMPGQPGFNPMPGNANQQNGNTPYNNAPYGYNPNMPQTGQQVPGNSVPHVPDMRAGIDMNDPQQNPLWGRWSAMAILSFACAILFPEFPALALVLGAASIWRTKLYHMRGRGFAIAAIVIAVIVLLLSAWVMSNPSLMQEMQNIMNSMPDSGTFGA